MSVLSREDFINEIYTPMKEQKEYENLVAVNEGLLKNLFGKIRNMFVDDWKKINGNDDIKSAYKEMDDRLSGFTMMKMSKRSQCNQIRQELVKFATAWYEYKMNKAKEDDTTPEIAKSMKFKNDTLKENLDSCEKAIKDIADGDAQITKWANMLMNGMKSVVNQVILKDLDPNDKDTQERIKKENLEEIKKQEKYNKELEKFQNKQLKEIEKERGNLMKNNGIDTVVDSELLGDAAMQKIYKEFDSIYQQKDDADKLKNEISNSKLLGLSKLFDEESLKKNKAFKMSLNMMDAFYEAMNKVGKKFVDSPGTSTQAMCVAVDAFIKNCVYETIDYPEKSQLELMARCAIMSNGAVSYNLPLSDEKVKDADGNDVQVNQFIFVINQMSSGKFFTAAKTSSGTKITVPADFKKNAETLTNKIVKEAEKIKEKAEKKYDDDLKKFDVLNK